MHMLPVAGIPDVIGIPGIDVPFCMPTPGIAPIIIARSIIMTLDIFVLLKIDVRHSSLAKKSGSSQKKYPCGRVAFGFLLRFSSSLLVELRGTQSINLPRPGQHLRTNSQMYCKQRGLQVNLPFHDER